MVEGIGYRTEVHRGRDGSVWAVHIYVGQDRQDRLASVWRWSDRRPIPVPGSIAWVNWTPSDGEWHTYDLDRLGNVLHPKPGDPPNLGWLLDLAMEAGLELDEPDPRSIGRSRRRLGPGPSSP